MLTWSAVAGGRLGIGPQGMLVSWFWNTSFYLAVSFLLGVGLSELRDRID